MTADRGVSRIEARLSNLGLASVLHSLLAGPLQEPLSLPLSSLCVAKATQRLLYGWLTYHPEVKAGLKMRLDEETATLVLLPTLGERRGRRHIY